MRIEVEKRNPYHDRKTGRFTTRGILGGSSGLQLSAGHTVDSTAKALVGLRNTDSKNPLSFPRAATAVLAHTYDISFNAAAAKLVAAGHKGTPLSKADKMFFRSRTDPLLSAKPSSSAYKAALAKVAITAEQIKRVENPLLAKKRKESILYEDNVLYNKTSVGEIDRRAKVAARNERVAAAFSMSPSSVAVADYFNATFRKAKSQIPVPANLKGKKISLDHKFAKAHIIADSKAAIDFINSRKNFEWLGHKENIAKSNKITWKTLDPAGIKFMSKESLELHRSLEKKNKMQFIKGGITQRQIDSAKSRNEWLRKNGHPVKKMKGF
jgi:hypothetical protein